MNVNETMDGQKQQVQETTNPPFNKIEEFLKLDGRAQSVISGGRARRRPGA